MRNVEKYCSPVEPEHPRHFSEQQQVMLQTFLTWQQAVPSLIASHNTGFIPEAQ